MFPENHFIYKRYVLIKNDGEEYSAKYHHIVIVNNIKLIKDYELLTELLISTTIQRIYRSVLPRFKFQVRAALKGSI